MNNAPLRSPFLFGGHPMVTALGAVSSAIRFVLSPIVPLLVLSLFFLVSCHDEDILTDTGSQPTFELNNGSTQHLGVLFPGRTTSTQKLLLYNRNDGTLKLESLVLRGGEESLFRINVDGMAGTSFTDPDFLRIAKGDSLHVLLEASFFGQQEEREAEYEDYIDILCNGRQTSIRLAVKVKNVEELHNDTIRQDTLWAAGGVDKLIYGPLVIPEGVTLTVDSGMTLFMHDQAGIQVNGSLRLQGSQEKPVRIIGDRTDSIFSNLAYVDMSAQWTGIFIYETSTANLFDHAEIMGMTFGITLGQDSLSEEQAEATPQLTIRNSLIKNSDASLINASATTMVIENSLLMNSGNDLLTLWGGAYDITHCTLANYQFWTAYPPYDLTLSNYAFVSDSIDGELHAVPVHSPLYRCNITNTIIYGNGSSAANVNIDYDGGDLFGTMALHDSIFHYRFDHCLIRANGEDDDDFISTVWNEDPMFQLVDMPNYICDPHLLPESPAVGKGNPSTLLRLPLDKDGRPRQNPPSIGCYEP